MHKHSFIAASNIIFLLSVKKGIPQMLKFVLCVENLMSAFFLICFNASSFHLSVARKCSPLGSMNICI